MAKKEYDDYGPEADFTWDFDLDQVLGDGYFNEEAYDFLGAFNRGLATAHEEYPKVVKQAILDRLDEVDLLDSGIPKHIKVETTKSVKERGYDIYLDDAGEHYKHVEYGTGIVGKNGPAHNMIKHHGVDWSYDINNHGSAGWFYPTDEDDPNPTKFTGSDGKTYAWTKGQTAKRFMYAGWKKASQGTIPKIRGEINNELRRLEELGQ